MARFIRQDLQIAATAQSLVGYLDNVPPTLAAYETNPTTIADDLNNVRSQIQNFLNRSGAGFPAGNWYDDLTAPSTLEAGTQRGIDALNDGLHLVEKKRVLRCYWSLAGGITIASAGDQYDILGTGELPGNTTAAVDAVTTLGTVVAAAASFGSAELTEVAGTTAINPKNLVELVEATTRDPILSGGRRVFGLLQSENAADGHTITDTATNRVMISFVRINASGTDLELIPSGDMDGVSYDYCYVERVRLEDLNEADFLGGASVDVPAGTTVTRQVAYDNQGTTPVDLTTNATLDLEGAGLTWLIRDDLEANLFGIVEGSAGGTSQVNIYADVDEFDVDAVVNDFANGVTMNSGGTRPIQVGVVDGVVGTTAGDLKLDAAALLAFEDSNKAGSGFGTDLVLSDSSGEWDTFETNFGEVSLLNAINQAYANDIKTVVQATLTSNVTAGNDVNGPGTPHNNTDVDLAPYDVVGFSAATVEVYLNGERLFTGVDVTAGGTPADGDLQFSDNLKGNPGNPDSFTMVVHGQ